MRMVSGVSDRGMALQAPVLKVRRHAHGGVGAKTLAVGWEGAAAQSAPDRAHARVNRYTKARILMQYGAVMGARYRQPSRRDVESGIRPCN
jgi:hypothetical protein